MGYGVCSKGITHVLEKYLWFDILVQYEPKHPSSEAKSELKRRVLRALGWGDFEAISGDSGGSAYWVLGTFFFALSTWQ